MDNYYDIEEPKKKKFTAFTAFKWIVAGIVILMYVVLVTRCALYSDDKIVSKILTNQTTLEAYNQNPENFAVYQYGMRDAWVAVKEGRLIEFNNLYHIPSAKQLQFSVKYNQDIAPHIGEDGIPFRFRLVDNNKNEYTDYFFETAKKSKYRFIRVCFNGIDLTENNMQSGEQQQKVYTLYIEKLDVTGKYSPLCNYKIYDGTTISRPVDYASFFKEA